MRTREELRLLQNLPLHVKIAKTKLRIREWVNHYGIDGVYLAWSGGKDSTVLRHIIMQEYPEIESVFVNTGLEYPEIQRFVKAAKDRGEPVTILRPEMRFDEVIKKYGYPVIGKEISHKVSAARNGANWAQKYVQGTAVNKNGEKSQYCVDKYAPLLESDFIISDMCCNVMKKKPAKSYAKLTGKVGITAQMADESLLRQQMWLQNGCNGFHMKRPISNPMSFWTEQDVLEYIKTYKVEIASVYGDVVYADEPEQMRLEEVADWDIG